MFQSGVCVARETHFPSEMEKKKKKKHKQNWQGADGFYVQRMHNAPCQKSKVKFPVKYAKSRLSIE